MFNAKRQSVSRVYAVVQGCVNNDFTFLWQHAIFDPRLVFNIRRPERVADALVSLHWLRVAERIVDNVGNISELSGLVGIRSIVIHRHIRD
jgi:hypothetical protein